MTQIENATTQFQQDQVKDFNTALLLLIQQQQEEYRDARRLSGITRQELREAKTAIDDVEQATREARVIYEAIVRPAIIEAAAKMIQHENIQVRSIGEALQSGDYRSLAL